MTNPVLNIDDAELIDFASPNGKFKAKLGRMGPALGLEKLGAMLTIVEPGKRAFPFHVHHATEEMFFIIDGEGEYRFGEETHPVKPGDLLSAPCGGPERAHQIVNTGKEPLKYLSVSAGGKMDVVEYPDSGKFAAFSSEDGSREKARLRYVGRTSSELDYFDGEDD